MTQILIKTFVSAAVIAVVSEIGKRSSSLAAILAAIPLTTFMTVIWLYAETKDTGKVADLTIGIFWAILPSFIFLLSLPWLLRNGFRFPSAMGISTCLLLAGYAIYIWILRRAGIVF